MKSLETRRKISKNTQAQIPPLSNPRILAKKLRTQKRNKLAGKHKKPHMTIKHRRALSNRMIDSPMYDPEIVAKKVETFHENFDEGTRKRYSMSVKKRWKDPKYKARLKLIHVKRAQENPSLYAELIIKANLVSRKRPSLRKRSKSKEKQQANARLLPKLGKEIKIRHTEEERENDYCGVVRE